MNSQLKQRLVGAVVLVALAVIFIPMLLPGKGDLSRGIDGSNIPPEPDYRFSAPVPAPEAPPMAAAPSLPVDDLSMDEAPDAPPVSSVKPSPVVTEPPKASPAKKATTPKAAPIKAAPSVALSEKSPQASGWVVQVGSFSSQPNAKALCEKLRKQGYACFVEAVQASADAVYRVRVGPTVSRATADKMRQKLLDVIGLQGLVQAYP
ncbi:MAG: SPOR domain-containing protein [Gammaproteobacteria bacterium]|nr:SPOR domain-containing protein [Gammaproteobacteria bacterium]